jgi:hypothetical protein
MDELELELKLVMGEDGVFREYKEPYCVIECPEKEDYDHIVEMVERGEKMRWIPISDRMPEIDQKVLIYTKTEIITCGWYTEAHGPAYNKGFETENGFMWLATASYWMPLPEPPGVDHDPN